MLILTKVKVDHSLTLNNDNKDLLIMYVHTQSRQIYLRDYFPKHIDIFFFFRFLSKRGSAMILLVFHSRSVGLLGHLLWGGPQCLYFGNSGIRTHVLALTTRTPYRYAISTSSHHCVSTPISDYYHTNKKDFF